MSAPLIGRRRELEAALRALAAGARWLTLTGPPGIGKSRLAAELSEGELGARSLRVRLGSVESDGEIPARLSEALGAPLRALRACGPIVIVLDDADRVSGGLFEIARELFEGAPDAAFVVTCRHPLGAPAEVVHELGPLDASDELFVALAGRARPGYAPDATELGYVRRIVAELDHNPLAIELAAARMGVMNAKTLLHRLNERFELLRRGPGPHGSLEAAFDSSFVTLEAHEQRALARASVFVATFSLAAAEAVIAIDQPVIDALQALRHKALLEVREIGGELQFSLARSVRDYAARKLDAVEREAALARHAEHYSRVTDRAQLFAERQEVLAVARRVLGARAVTAKSAGRALSALLALEPVLASAASLDAHISLVARVVEATAGSGADPVLIARAFLLRGRLRWRTGELAAASADLVRALSSARALGDAPLEAAALSALARALFASGDLAAAREHVERALSLASATRDLTCEADALACLSELSAGEGEPRQALALAERAREARRLTADPLGEITALGTLIERRLDLGALDEAASEIEVRRKLCDTIGDREGAATTELLGAELEHARGELARARTLYTRAAADLASLGLGRSEGVALGLLGLLARREGKHAEAHALLGQALRQLGDEDRALGAILSVARAGLDVDIGRALPELAGLPEGARVLFELEQARRAGDPAPALERAREHAKGSFAVRMALSAVQAALAARPEPLIGDDALVIEHAGLWFRPPHAERVALDRRRPLALLLARLARERRENPGQALTWDTLLSAGWPGQRVIADAGAHRVRVAVSTLRKLGLSELLTTTPDGYLLRADVPLEVV